MEGSGRGLIMALFWHLPAKTQEKHENLSQDTWCPAQYFNL
jgi:hypothetical protein